MFKLYINRRRATIVHGDGGTGASERSEDGAGTWVHLHSGGGNIQTIVTNSIRGRYAWTYQRSGGGAYSDIRQPTPTQ
jgi:hypothetical protein